MPFRSILQLQSDRFLIFNPINFEDTTRRIRCFQPDRFGKTNPIDSESGLAADGRLSRTEDMPREFALGKEKRLHPYAVQQQ